MCYGQRSLYNVETHAFTARHFCLECVKCTSLHRKASSLLHFPLFVNLFHSLFYLWSLKNRPQSFTFLSLSHSTQKHHLLILYCSIIQTTPLFLLYFKMTLCLSLYLCHCFSLHFFQCHPFSPPTPLLCSAFYNHRNRWKHVTMATGESL